MIASILTVHDDKTKNWFQSSVQTSYVTHNVENVIDLTIVNDNTQWKFVGDTGYDIVIKA